MARLESMAGVPNRRSALCGAAIRVGLRSADLTDSILRNVDAVKEALRKEVELSPDECPLPPTVIVPPLPQKEIPSREPSQSASPLKGSKRLLDDYGTGHKDKFQVDVQLSTDELRLLVMDPVQPR